MNIFTIFFSLIKKKKIIAPSLAALWGFSLKMVSQLFQAAQHNLGMEMNCSHWEMD